MRFRPCIDLHNGVVKQIVGSTLKDSTADSSDTDPVENFASSLPSEEYARMYQRDKLEGGHVIMLGPGNEEAAMAALRGYPGGLQVGGGITPANARKYLDAGASHVIVTSYVFKDGKIRMDKLNELVAAVGKDRLVLDLSCRRKPDAVAQGDTNYYVVTDRWQKFTDYRITRKNLQILANSCSEFLIHGVDVEGKQCGIMEDLVELLGKWSPIPCTYAGGIRDESDVELVGRLGQGRVDFTIGSALDIFGGQLSYAKIAAWDQEQAARAGKESGTVVGSLQLDGRTFLLASIIVAGMALVAHFRTKKGAEQQGR